MSIVLSDYNRAIGGISYLVVNNLTFTLHVYFVSKNVGKRKQSLRNLYRLRGLGFFADATLLPQEYVEQLGIEPDENTLLTSPIPNH